VKGIFDGVVCAFQAHTDTVVLPEVTTRLSEDIPMPPEMIERRKSYVPRPKLDSVAVRQLLRLVEMFGAHECSSTPQGERRDAPARR